MSGILGHSVIDNTFHQTKQHFGMPLKIMAIG